MRHEKFLPYADILKTAYIEAKFQTVVDMQKSSGADIVLNAGIYEPATGALLLAVINDGKYLAGPGRYIDTGGLVLAGMAPRWDTPRGIQGTSLDFVTSYRPDGTSPNYTQKRGRTLIGGTADGVHIEVRTDGADGLTWPQAQARMTAKGCAWVWHGDAGGSSSAVDGVALCKPTVLRQVCGGVGIWIRRPTLRRGYPKADSVRRMQHLLNWHGEALNEDGLFGPATEAAVRRYQQKHRLAVDGICGPKTWARLEEV